MQPESATETPITHNTTDCCAIQSNYYNSGTAHSPHNSVIYTGKLPSRQWFDKLVVQTLQKYLQLDEEFVEHLTPLLELPTILACLIDHFCSDYFDTNNWNKNSNQIHLEHLRFLSTSQTSVENLITEQQSNLTINDNLLNAQVVLRFINYHVEVNNFSINLKNRASKVIDRLQSFVDRSTDDHVIRCLNDQDFHWILEFYDLFSPSNYSLKEHKGILQTLLRNSAHIAKTARPAHPKSRPIPIVNQTAVKQLVHINITSSQSDLENNPEVMSVLNENINSSHALDPVAISDENHGTANTLLTDLIHHLSSNTNDVNGENKAFYLNQSCKDDSVSKENNNDNNKTSNTCVGNKPFKRTPLYATFTKHPTPQLSDKLPTIGSPSYANNPNKRIPPRARRLCGSVDTTDPSLPSLRTEFEKRKRSLSNLRGESMLLTESGKTDDKRIVPDSLPTGTTTWVQIQHRQRSTTNPDTEISSTSSGSTLHQQTPDQSSSRHAALRMSFEQRRRSILMSNHKKQIVTSKLVSNRNNAAFLKLIQEQRQLSNVNPTKTENVTENSEKQELQPPSFEIGSTTDAIKSQSPTGNAFADTTPFEPDQSVPDTGMQIGQTTDVDEDFSLKSTEMDSAKSESVVDCSRFRDFKLVTEDIVAPPVDSPGSPDDEPVHTPVHHPSSKSSYQKNVPVHHMPRSSSSSYESGAGSTDDLDGYICSVKSYKHDHYPYRDQKDIEQLTSNQSVHESPLRLRSHTVRHQFRELTPQPGFDTFPTRKQNGVGSLTSRNGNNYSSDQRLHVSHNYNETFPRLNSPNTNKSPLPNRRPMSGREYAQNWLSRSTCSWSRNHRPISHSQHYRTHHGPCGQSTNWDYDCNEKNHREQPDDVRDYYYDDDNISEHDHCDCSQHSDRFTRSRNKVNKSYSKNSVRKPCDYIMYDKKPCDFGEVAQPDSPSCDTSSLRTLDSIKLDEINRNLMNLKANLERLSLQQQQQLSNSSLTSVISSSLSTTPISLPETNSAIVTTAAVIPSTPSTSRATWSDRLNGKDLPKSEIRQTTDLLGTDQQVVLPDRGDHSHLDIKPGIENSLAAHSPNYNHFAIMSEQNESATINNQNGSAEKSESQSFATQKRAFFIEFEERDPERLQRTRDRLETRRAYERAQLAEQLENARKQEKKQKDIVDQVQQGRKFNEKGRRVALLQAHLSKKDAHESSTNPYPVRSGSSSLSKSEANLSSGLPQRNTSNRLLNVSQKRLGKVATSLDTSQFPSRRRVRTSSAVRKSSKYLPPTRGHADGEAVEVSEDQESICDSSSMTNSSYRSRSQLPSGLSLSSLHRLGATESPSSGPGLPVQSFHHTNYTSDNIQNAVSTPKLFVKPKAKSNRMVITNAISHCCLAGTVNEPIKQLALKGLASTPGTHFMILFRDSRCQYRAIYVFDLDTEELRLICGTGPRKITHEMANRFFKYNSGAKQFSEITSTKHLSAVVDAITIHDSLWTKSISSHNSSSLTASHF